MMHGPTNLREQVIIHDEDQKKLVIIFHFTEIDPYKGLTFLFQNNPPSNKCRLYV
jgi:hypothetical protein